MERCSLQSTESSSCCKSSDVSSVIDACYVMFEPDVMLPSQFYGANDGLMMDAERNLMAAILSDGVEAYIASSVSRQIHQTQSSSIPQLSQQLHNNKKRTPTRNEAQDWVETHDDTYAFSFDNVCASLGINPDYLRLGLLRYVTNYVRATQERKSAAHRMGDAWKRIRRPRRR